MRSGRGALVRIVFLTLAPYGLTMKATMTSKGQVTIPAAIRKRLKLEAGQVLDFDEAAPFLKAMPVFDEARMRSVTGRGKGALGMSSAKWLNETRGPALKKP